VTAGVALYKNRRYEKRHARRSALKTGAPEPLFFYHAGMIAQAMGDTATARETDRESAGAQLRFDIRQRRWRADTEGSPVNETIHFLAGVRAATLFGPSDGQHQREHYAAIPVDGRGVDCATVLDLAEIPTFEMLRSWS